MIKSLGASKQVHNMWAMLKRSLVIKKGENAIGCPQSLNVNEEYLSAFKTESYADFFTKAQFLVTEAENSSSSLSCSYTQLSHTLLEPAQETIPHILQSTSLCQNPDLKDLVSNYFQISAEASMICSHLLKSINQTQSNHQFIQRALEIISDSSPDHQLKSVITELDAFLVLQNPFSNLNGCDHFKVINERYATILRHLKSRRKKVARKIKAIKFLKQGSSICLMTACGAVVLVGIVLTLHSLVGLALGPAIFSISPSKLKKKLPHLQNLRTGLLEKLKEQLDMAAKGAYILNRDFDTMSRLVARVHDEIEHKKAMIQFCVDRKEDVFLVQEVLKELRKTDEGFMKQVDELEELVYLCLVTINRARIQVVKEITKNLDRNC